MSYIDVVFDGPPSRQSGRFVEVENSNGASISVGEWIDRGNGLWALRLPRSSAKSTTTEPHEHEWHQLPRNVNFCVACGAIEET
jgi:hypothetical protein